MEQIENYMVMPRTEYPTQEESDNEWYAYLEKQDQNWEDTRDGN